MAEIAAAILAAGQGTRMKSSLPKVLHPVAGLPMVLWSVRTARALGADPIALVVGVGAEAVEETVGTDVLYASQAQQPGHGPCRATGRDAPAGQEPTPSWSSMAICPTLRPETLQRCSRCIVERRPAMTMLTVIGRLDGLWPRRA